MASERSKGSGACFRTFLGRDGASLAAEEASRRRISPYFEVYSGMAGIRVERKTAPTVS